jgi:hypothetical protein
MEVSTLLQAIAQQQGASPSGDGVTRDLRATRVGQLFVADWKTELVLAGRAYNVSVGGISAGADVALITGGGNGTTIDSDQPEMAVGTPTGYYHIPLGFEFAGQVDIDADQEEGNVLLFADTSQIIPLPIAASSTVETPQPLLGGGQAAVSSAQSAVTTDITDPVVSQILAFATTAGSQITAVGYAVPDLQCHWYPPFPILLKGPCSVIACWGGTAAVVGACSYFFAEVPIAQFA